jgi:hypothetical protein
MKTPGEALFEEYLQILGLKFEYEPPIGSRRPDFLVHSSAGDVLCEIKDFELNDEDRAELDAALAGKNTFSSRSLPFSRIQLRIRAASRQLREFKGKYPCLVVLFDPAAVAYLMNVTVLGAMYGEVKLRVPIDINGGGVFEATNVYDHESRYLTPNSNTTVSAVAILERVRPIQRLVDEAASKEDFGTGPDRTTRMIQFIYEFSEKHPEVFDQVPRLHVFQNIYAAVPWPRPALSGPNDSFWQ